MKFQAVRDGQFIGAPQDTEEEAKAIIDRDREYTTACYEQGWITKRGYLSTTWYIRRVS